MPAPSTRPYAVNSQTPPAVPGCSTPHLRCEAGASLYDAMGPEFTSLRFGSAVNVAPLEDAARNRGMPLKVSTRTTRRLPFLMAAGW